MKKKLIDGLIVSALAVSFSCASAADRVAQWDDFSNLTSGDYSLTTSGSTRVVDGVLNVVGASGGSANVDLTSAALTLNKGLTISAKISNIGTFSGGGPFSVFAFATEATPFATLVGYDNSHDKIQFALNGGTGNISSTAVNNSASDLEGDTPVILTATFTKTSFKVYLNGEEIATGTPGNNKITDAQANSPITQLSLGSWAGASSYGRLTEKVYNLAVYNGAMTASEVKSLVVPEPATATLSLLALACLAARRRR